MLDLFVNEYNGGVAIDRDYSFMVGDAAGRRGDPSECDKGEFSLDFRYPSNLLRI